MKRNTEKEVKTVPRSTYFDNRIDIEQESDILILSLYFRVKYS